MGKGSSKAGGNLYKGHYVEGTPGAFQKQADEVVKGTKDVLKDFGAENELRGIYFSKKGTITKGHADASMNGLGDLHISTVALSQGEKDSKGYLISDSYMPIRLKQNPSAKK